MGASNHYAEPYKSLSVDSPPTPVDPSDLSARSKVTECNYTTDNAGEYGTLESGDTVYLCTPDKGERLKAIVLDADDMGTAPTFSIGIPGTTGKFMSAVDVHTAAVITADLVAGCLGYEFDGETPIIVTVADGNCDDAKSFKIVVETYQYRP